MQYVWLGNSEITVSQLCVGCMSFGKPSEDFHLWTWNPEETEMVVRKALDELVKSGKVRALDASAVYGYQFHNMQLVAEKNGWTKFVSMQNYYNLLYCEDEREMIPICRQYNVSLTPYSPLAAGRLAAKRSQTDQKAAQKYDGTEKTDCCIVKRVCKDRQQVWCNNVSDCNSMAACKGCDISDYRRNESKVF